MRTLLIALLIAAPLASSADQVQARRPGVLLAGSGVLNALRAGDGAAAQVGAGLRWRLVDVQWNIGFPALSLFGQVRVSLLERFRLIPYLTVGVAIAYNNGTDRDSTLAAVGGAGARLRIYRRLELYTELLINVLLVDSLPSGPAVENRHLSLPLLVGLSVEI